MNSLGRQLCCQCGLSGGIPAFELFIGWHSSMVCYCDFPQISQNLTQILVGTIESDLK